MLDPVEVGRVVRAALAEDLRYGPDVTSSAVIPLYSTNMKLARRIYYSKLCCAMCYRGLYSRRS